MHSLFYDGTSVSYPTVTPYNIKPCSNTEQKIPFFKDFTLLIVRPKNGCKGRNVYMMKSVSNEDSAFSTQHDGFWGGGIFSTHHNQGVFQRI